MLVPPRPLRIRFTFVLYCLAQAFGCGLVAVAVVAGVGWWQWHAAQAILAKEKIWAEGVPAPFAKVDGKVTVYRFVVQEFDLQVSYRDAQGRPHAGKVEFFSLGWPGKKSAPPEVRYLPNAPEQFATLTEVDEAKMRWIIGLGGVAIALGIGWKGLHAMLIFLWGILDTVRCSRRSEEVYLWVSSRRPYSRRGKEVGTLFVYTARKEDGTELAGEAVFLHPWQPLFADAGEQCMVALAAPSAPKRLVHLRDDFHPYRLSRPQREAIYGDPAEQAYSAVR